MHLSFSPSELPALHAAARERAQAAAPFLPVLAERLTRARETAAAVNAASDIEQRTALRRERQRWEQGMAQAAIERSLTHHLLHRTPLESRLVWFWCNHFSVLFNKGAVRYTLDSFEFDAVAPRILGSFSDLLLNASLHPAMLAYLDNTQNRAGRINENLAREILELHTLGVDGGYTQNDVQQLALALTGIGIAGLDRDNPARLCDPPECDALNAHGAVLRPRQHQSGPKRLLGKTYDSRRGLEAIDMLNDLARHPATARHISRKLCRFWLADEPSAAAVQTVSQRFLQTGGNLLQTTEAVLNLLADGKPDGDGGADSEPRLKDPFRFLLDANRALLPAEEGRTRLNARPLAQALRNLGMGHYQRVSPDGYPLVSSAWNNNATLLLRMQVVNQQVGQYRNMWPQADWKAELRGMPARLKPLLSDATLAALEPVQPHPVEWIATALMAPEFMFESRSS